MPDKPQDSAPLPAGATWTGDWDEDFHDRIFGADPIVVGQAAALLTGVQHRDGATVSGVALRVDGTVIDGQQRVAADLTPDQARELAAVLLALAARAEELDGLTPGRDTTGPT